MTIDRFLKSSPIDSLDTRVLVCEICGLEPADLITKADRELTVNEISELEECVSKRKEEIPLAYILEHKDFWKLTFYTPAGVLIPRPDTETMVEEAAGFALGLSKKNLEILDVFAGSGCIGISVADEVHEHFENLHLSLSDISPEAYDCFSVNADNLLWGRNIDVSRYCGNLFETVKDQKFDIITANPPYIETNEIEKLAAEVKNEPVLALDGGKDGMDLIRKTVSSAVTHLNEGGMLFMEIGYNQGSAVKKLFEDAGFTEVTVIKDLGNNDRVVRGKNYV